MTRSSRVILTACVLSALPFMGGRGWTADPTLNDPEALREATKVLEEEAKLAARPLVYLLLDLPERSILIKGRGIELHRLPIMAWRDCGKSPPGNLYRLRERPPVERQRTTSPDDPSLDPIELHDMPAEYVLAFMPNLIVTVAPPAREHPWLWMKSHLREWWNFLTLLLRRLGGFEAETEGLRLRLTLSQEAAQSFAWSVTDGMPLLIRRVLDRQETPSARPGTWPASD